MSLVATMNPEPQPMDAETKSRLASVPAWGSYLYQNFLLPAFSPTASMTEWLNLNTPFAALTPRAGANSQAQASQPPQHQAPMDYFGNGWGKEEGPMGGNAGPSSSNQQSVSFGQADSMQGAQQPNFSHFSFGAPPSAPPMQQSMSHPSFSRNSESGPSSHYNQQYNYTNDRSNSNAISTSLLMAHHSRQFAGPPPSSAPLPFPHRPSLDGPSQSGSRNSLNIVDGQLTHSPSPMTSRAHSPVPSPKRAGKRRFDSLDSEEHEHDSDHEPDVPEGVERDGMIWGMKVDAYRALSARERKRVRNRISARTFRAKRKEHLVSLEESSNVKDLKLRLANEENARLQQEVIELRRRLAKYEH